MNITILDLINSPKNMLTNRKPDKAGYYWWTDGREPLQVLKVDHYGSSFYAEGGEMSFNVEVCEDEDLWEYIKPPRVPKRKNLTGDED